LIKGNFFIPKSANGPHLAGPFALFYIIIRDPWRGWVAAESKLPVSEPVYARVPVEQNKKRGVMGVRLVLYGRPKVAATNDLISFFNLG
jgi:hypothetical protein